MKSLVKGTFIPSSRTCFTISFISVDRRKLRPFGSHAEQYAAMSFWNLGDLTKPTGAPPSKISSLLLPDLQVKHLKKWDAQSLIKTDMFDRAAPWTELIWDHFIRRKPRVLNDLNLDLSYRSGKAIAFTSRLMATEAWCALITPP